MELTVKTLQGSYLVSGLNNESTIADLKRMLHQQYRQQVPEPEEQRLVGHQAFRLMEQQHACTARGRPTDDALQHLNQHRVYMISQVFKHSVLSSTDAALEQLGITHGDQLVMLSIRPTIKRPRAQTTPVSGLLSLCLIWLVVTESNLLQLAQTGAKH